MPSRTPSTLGDGGGDGLAAESARARVRRAVGRALPTARCAPSRWRPTPWCDAMLEGDGGHIKELYRRGQAHEQLGNDRLGLAMKDYTRLLHMERANKASPSAGSTSPAPQRTRTNAPGRGRAHPVLLCAFLDRTLSPSFPSSCTLSPPSSCALLIPKQLHELEASPSS